MFKTKLNPVWFWLVFLISAGLTNAQQVKVHGIIYDESAMNGLPFGNIKVLNSYKGTAANLNGEYEMNLEAGNYTLVATYMGFRSDTVEVEVNKNTEVNFFLQPQTVELAEVTVIPGENPALEIIRRASETRRRREEKLASYIVESYTKGLIYTEKDITANDNSLTINTGSGELKITGILENKSQTYFKDPDNMKEIIIARKQSANFPSSINVITGSRLIQDFYSENLNFFERPLKGPISSGALEYYSYELRDTLNQNGKAIFKIFLRTQEETDPGFEGWLYIEDDSFALITVDMSLNRAANPGGLFSKISILQQYLGFEEDIYMPVDYRLYAEANPFGIAHFALELNSIMYDYKINPEINDDFFDYSVITVREDADEKEKDYWENVQSIPPTQAELEAYQRIDSLESVEKSFWDKFSPLSEHIYLNDHFYVPGPLALYRFNRVEEHALTFETGFDDLMNDRLDLQVGAAYGFGDKEFKSEFYSNYRFGRYRTGRIRFSAFDRLASLFEESNRYNTFTSTILNLVSRYDFRDYYYSRGGNVSVSDYLLPFLNLGIGVNYYDDRSANVNADFSFFNTDKEFNKNRSVLDGETRSVDLTFGFDFRKYIEDAKYRRRIGRNSVSFDGKLTYGESESDLFGGLDNFIKGDLTVSGEIPTFGGSALSYNLNGFYSDGQIPYQHMDALPGNINSGAKDFSFRTVRVAEVFGDRTVSLFLDHNFRDELFRLTGISFLEKLQLYTSVHFDAAWVSISEENEKLIPFGYKEYLNPLYEIGFGIGHPLFPLKFEFTWRLNHREDRGFVFGINSFAL